MRGNYKPHKNNQYVYYFAILKAFLHCIIGWSFLFFSLKTMKTRIPDLHYIWYAIPLFPPLTYTKPAELRKINSPWKTHCNMCQEALLVHQTFSPQNNQYSSPRQTISTYMYFWKSDHYTRNFLPFSKNTEIMTETIYRVGLRGNCVVVKMPPTLLYA